MGAEGQRAALLCSRPLRPLGGGGESNGLSWCLMSHRRCQARLQIDWHLLQAIELVQARK